MKNNKMLLIGGGIAVLLIICAVFMFGGGGATLKQAQKIINTDPRQAIEILLPYTEKKPEDAKGWLLLGDAYKAIEEYGMPIGDKKNAVLAYWEGFKLGDDECRKRLAWETCPLVSVYMESPYLAHSFTRDDYDEAYAQYNAVRKDDSKTEQEKLEAILWLRIVTSLNWELFLNNFRTTELGLETIWIDLLATKPLTDEDYLFIAYVPKMIVYWEGVYLDKSNYVPIEISQQKIYSKYAKEIETAMENGLKSNNPLAIELQVMQLPGGHFSFASRGRNARPNIFLDSINVKFEESREQRIKLLEPIRNKLTNNGKLLLAEAYQLNESEKTIQLIKESLKGPYALYTYPEMALATIYAKTPLPESELQNIKNAILNARYTEAGGQWKDVFARAQKEPIWDGSVYVPLDRDVMKGNYPWLMLLLDPGLSLTDNDELGVV